MISRLLELLDFLEFSSLCPVRAGSGMCSAHKGGAQAMPRAFEGRRRAAGGAAGVRSSSRAASEGPLELRPMAAPLWCFRCARVPPEGRSRGARGALERREWSPSKWRPSGARAALQWRPSGSPATPEGRLRGPRGGGPDRRPSGVPGVRAETEGRP